MTKKLSLDPALKMKVCGWAGLIGMAIMQVWYDNPDLVRVGMFLTAVSSASGVMMARHRHVSDEQSGATERYLKAHFKEQGKMLRGKRPKQFDNRHD